MHRRHRFTAQPTDVGLEPPQLLFCDPAAEGGHPNRLAIEEEPGDRIRLQALWTPIEDPLSQLGFVHHEFLEITAVPRRDLTLEAPGIPVRAASARTVAAKAAKPFGDCMARPGQRLLRHVGAGQRAQVGDEIIDLGIRESLAPGRHPYRRRLEGPSELRILAHTPRRTVEDPLLKRFPLDVIQISELPGE